MDLITELESSTDQARCKLMLDIYVTAPTSAADDSATEKKGHCPNESHEMVQRLPALAQAGAGSSSSSSSEDLAAADTPSTTATAGTLQAIAAKSGLLTVKVFAGRPESMSRLHAHISAPGSENHVASNHGKVMDEIHFAACGPPSLCDDIRGEALALMRQNRRISLSQDCFSY